jgi:nitrite reductase/ring-hydroxylating ferredoxin subunit
MGERVKEQQRARVGTIEELKAKGCLAGKVGSQPVCVFWSDGEAFAVDDRCPHMGFPLHRGTVENGLLTCHWHHARFDLASGGTLDPFADDVRAHGVEVDGADVFVVLRAADDPAGHHLRRLAEGLEQGFTLVLAKAVLGLMELLGPEQGALAAVREGADFGLLNREEGWGAGLTVLTAMANVLPALAPQDRPLALVHGLRFVSRNTRGHPPRFALPPLPAAIPPARLASWYRRFIDTRNGDAAERALATATVARPSPEALVALMGVAVTDHVFVDGGHTIDFTNKAFELLGHLGWDRAEAVLPTLAQQTAAAGRSEETGEWRHPHDLPGLLASLQSEPADYWSVAAPGPIGGTLIFDDKETEALAWDVLGDDPGEIVAALDHAAQRGASAEQLARAVAYAAALRLTRFHTQNDHGDWDIVHHGFTTANATHQLINQAATPELLRGVYQTAMKVFLDRFLNIPAARLPGQHAAASGPSSSSSSSASSASAGAATSSSFSVITGGRSELSGLSSRLQACWDREGMVDEAGAIVYGWLRDGGEVGAVLEALGSALLNEDADFHWYQTYEAAVRQAAAWPAGSEPVALILAGAARFLAAHTPTRRELAQVVRIAARLRRGEALYEDV